MRRTVTILILGSFHLWAECLQVNLDATTSTCSGININSLTKTFITTMNISDTSVAFEAIDIYIKSDSTKEIKMRLTNNNPLTHTSFGDTITTKFYYKKSGGAEVEITNDGTPFSLLADGENIADRDGSTLIGILIVKAKNLADDQTAGEYQLSQDMVVTLDTDDSGSSTLTNNANVNYLTIVGLADTSSITSGEKFVGAEVDFGTLTLGSSDNEILKNVYLNSNSKEDCIMTLDPKNMEHESYSAQTIPMHYYYTQSGGTEHEITDTTAFTLHTGKGNGGTVVGEMKFKTGTLGSIQMAGNYSATLNVTISAR